MVDVPDDLAWDVARALESRASIYRNDDQHDPEDVATLKRDADRLDELASHIDGRLGEASAPLRTPA